MRELKNFNHDLDPLAHPDIGSETASFIMIDEADLKDLKDPSILACFSNSLIFSFCTSQGRSMLIKRSVRRENSMRLTPICLIFLWMLRGIAWMVAGLPSALSAANEKLNFQIFFLLQTLTIQFCYLFFVTRIYII